ncbi:transcription elongation factor GreAB [Pontiella sp.]|uniref:transcription elongation factor GreAB n=1 Tax=Pontiella sp. TaxID=2837462 RepID=UPI0035652A3C
MDKKVVLKAVLTAMEEELRRQLKGQEMAAEGATHAEAKAETKWDTCGLEQSYLARGLARQFEKLAKEFEDLRAFRPEDFSGKPIGIGALIEAEMEGFKDLFFLLDCGGGTEVRVDGREITVITPESPVGAALVGKFVGDAYSFRAGMDGRVLSVE